MFAARMADRVAPACPRRCGLEPQFAELLPELVSALSPDEFAALAARALDPAAGPRRSASTTCTRRWSASASRRRIVVERLRRVAARRRFRALIADADRPLVVVARFLALLELYREGAVAFEQVDAARRAARPLDRRGRRRGRRRPTSSTTSSEPDGTDARRRHEAEPRREDQSRRPDAVTAEADDSPTADSRRRRTGPTSRRRGPRARCVDVDDLPGGAAGALEAMLMVVDEPVADVALATALEPDRRPGPRRAGARSPRSTTSRPRLRAARGRRRLAVLQPRRRTPRWSSGSCSTASTARLTQAALETLAVVAYRQPVSRGPGLGRPRGQRRRRHAHPGHPRPGRGGRHRPRDRRDPLRHHRATSWSGSACHASTSCRRWRRSCPRWTRSTSSSGDRAADPRSSGAAVDAAAADAATAGRWGHEPAASTRGSGHAAAGSAAGPGLHVRRLTREAARAASAQARQPAPEPPAKSTSTTRTASGCRRCWPRPGWAAAAPARS